MNRSVFTGYRAEKVMVLLSYMGSKESLYLQHPSDLQCGAGWIILYNILYFVSEKLFCPLI